jgi:hypothetical protein
MVCVHLLSYSNICGGIWGISFCRIGIAMVVGGVWWLMVDGV